MRFLSFTLLCGLLITHLCAQTLQQVITTDAEPNESITQFNDLGVVGISGSNRFVRIVRGTIQPDGDLDFFRFQVLQAGTYTMRVDTTYDSVITLYNSSGAILAENDDDEPGNNNLGNRDTSYTNTDSGITRTLQPGFYFVRVMSVASSGPLAQFRYSLRLFDGSNAPDVDPYEVDQTNNTFETATYIGPLSEQVTNITNGFLRYRNTDFDYYKVEIGAGNMQVRTFGATDTILTVYDSAFNPLATNDDDPFDALNTFQSRVNLNNLAAGEYYIRVEGYNYPGGRAGGWYDITISGVSPLQRRISGFIETSITPLSGIPLNFKIRPAGSNTILRQHNVTTTEGGAYTFVTGFTSGTYDIACKGPTTLTKIARNVSLNANVTGLGFFLRNGDINGDDRIDDVDLLIVLFGFGTPNGDLNGDGITDDIDLLIVLFNFGQEGEQ